MEAEDPYWIWTLTISQTEELAGLLVSGKAYSYIDIGDDIKAVLGIDFFAQAEADVEQAIAGFTTSEVEDWAYSLGEGLGICAYYADTKVGHPRNPHCWVFVPTDKYHVGFQTLLGFVGAIFEIPAFGASPQVAYCPKGTTYCNEV